MVGHVLTGVLNAFKHSIQGPIQPPYWCILQNILQAMKSLVLEQTHTLVVFCSFAKIHRQMCVWNHKGCDLGVKCGFSFVDSMKSVVNT